MTEDNRRRLFTPRQRAQIFQRAQGKCELCGQKVRGQWVAGHVLPFHLGGETVIENGRVECAACAALTAAHDKSTAAKVRRLQKTMAGERSRKRRGPAMKSANTLGGEKYQRRKEWAHNARGETE